MPSTRKSLGIARTLCSLSDAEDEQGRRILMRDSADVLLLRRFQVGFG
jgi:hypothetical protein